MNKLLSDIAGQGAQNECNFSPWEGGKINAFCAWGGVFFGGRGNVGGGVRRKCRASWQPGDGPAEGGFSEKDRNPPGRCCGMGELFGLSPRSD